MVFLLPKTESHMLLTVVEIAYLGPVALSYSVKHCASQQLIPNWKHYNRQNKLHFPSTLTRGGHKGSLGGWIDHSGVDAVQLNTMDALRLLWAPAGCFPGVGKLGVWGRKPPAAAPECYHGRSLGRSLQKPTTGCENNT